MANGREERVLWGAGTARTLRVVWALHELGLPYTHRKIGSRTGETRTEEFTRINPRQKIPVLQDRGLTLVESAAIVTWLGETYAAQAGISLVPGSGRPERARYFEWSFFVMTELDAHRLYVLRKHDDLRELYGEAPAALETARAGFERQVRAAARAFSETGGPYALGPWFSGADILLATTLDWGERRELELPASLRGYLEMIRSRPAYQAAWEANR